LSEKNQTSYSKYVSGMKNLLNLFYGTKDLNSSYRKHLDHKIQGYIEAGIISDLITKEELQKIIDDEHYSIFKMTRKERREKLKLSIQSPEIDWSIYDVPTIERNYN
jgi:hypothetical protein